MFPKEIGDLAGSRHSSHIKYFIRQNPLAACIIVEYSGGSFPQDQHVVGISRQLLWGEESRAFFYVCLNIYRDQEVFVEL